LLVADSPENFNCERCVFTKKQNRVRGRDCLLGRNYKSSPLPYSFRVGNKDVKGVIHSEEELFQTIEKAFDVYKTDDIEIALRRIGKGICPKSFPMTRQSFYFLDIHSKTHGGESGNTLINLPNEGGVLDQPNIFFSATDVISSVRARSLRKRYGQNDNKNTGSPVSSPSDREENGPKFGRS
jgi:hypothetical protein